MSTIISLKHVDHYYDKGKENEVHALIDINLEIEQGDYVAFFGPSGCGKTTLLYAISGIDRVTSGEILVKDRDIAHFPNRELALFRQTGIGIVFQQFNLVPSLTVLENIALPMSFVGMNKKKAEEEAQKLVVRLGLEKYAAHYPSELSGGQQQRVGIARALANAPPLIIADEPIGNLDSVNAKNVLAILKDLNEKDGKTIIMVTHEAWSLQDVRTIFHMKDGAIASVEKRVPTIMEASKKDPAADLAKQLKKEAASAEEMTLMVRILSNFFMRGHSLDEMQRFESLLRMRLEQTIDAGKFISSLKDTFDAGGAGLWGKKAERISAYIESLLSKKQSLNAAIELINGNPELPISEEIQQLRRWILEEYVGNISSDKVDILDELVADRIRRFISAAQFLEFLHEPVKNSGAGFPLPSAQKMAERLEIVVSGTEAYAPAI